MHEHMKGWVGAGHSVTLFSSYYKGGKKQETVDGIDIIRWGVQLLGVHVLAAFWYLFSGHPKFDLVIDQFHGIPFFTPFYVRTKKLAVIQEVAREVWLMNSLPKPLNLIIGYTGYLLEPLIFLFYKNTIFMTGSESTKKDLVRFGIPSENINIVPHGVLAPKPEFLGLRSKVKTVIYLGALTKDKGVEDALKTFSILNKMGEFNFWVVGRASPKYLNKLKLLSNKYGISKKVRFWGYVTQRKKFELLSKAYVLINPSVREGWGLVNIEANSAGTPVVSYNSPGLVDSVGNGISGVIVGDNTPREMASVVEKIINNKNLYKRLHKGAISWSKKFSWKNSTALSLMLIDRFKNKR